jgi:hypothetical protein
MNWRDEWIGMPEFVQDEKKPDAQIPSGINNYGMVYNANVNN